MNEVWDILITWPNDLFGTIVNNTLDARWWSLLTKLQFTKTT